MGKSAGALPAISVLAVTDVCAAVVSGNRESIAAAGILVFVSVLLHNLTGLGLGYLVGLLLRLDADKRRAISVEVGIQNAGLGVSLSSTHFAAQPLTALLGAVAVVMHVIKGSILASIWSRRPIKKENTDEIAEEKVMKQA